MSAIIYNILVPVNFSSKDKWAIAKAIELANTFQCNIHLVHVVSSPLAWLEKITNWFIYDKTIQLTNARKQLEKLRDDYRQHLCGNGKIEISLLKGEKAAELIQYIDNFNMDMVVMGLSKFSLLHRILSSVTITKLARKTAVPVLAIRASGLVSHFKKIVLPVAGEIPMRRLKMATMLVIFIVYYFYTKK